MANVETITIFSSTLLGFETMMPYSPSGCSPERQAVGAFPVFLGREGEVFHGVGLDGEGPDGRNHRRTVLLRAFHPEDAHDRHQVGFVVLGADDEGERLSGFEPYSGPAAFDDYFLSWICWLRIRQCIRRRRFASERCVFRVFADDPSEYIPTTSPSKSGSRVCTVTALPPKSWPLRPSGIGFFFIVI